MNDFYNREGEQARPVADSLIITKTVVQISWLRPETPRVKKLVSFSILVMLGFFAIVFYQGYSSHQTAVQDAKADAERLSKIMSDHVELTFLSIDLSLRRAVERQYFNEMAGGNLPEYMEHNFSVWVRELPQISAMMLINEQGYVVASAYESGFENFIATSKSVEGTLMVEEGRYQSAQDSYFYFTPGIKKDDPSSAVIIMSRKLQKPDGSFGGMVMAAINSAYFVDFFDSISQGQHHFMALQLTGGSTVVEGPRKSPYATAIRDAIHNLPPLKETKPTLSTMDVQGRDKILIRSPISSFPLTLAITLDSADYLNLWHSNQFKDGLFLLIFLLFGTSLSLFAITMEKQIKKVQQSEAAALLASQTKSEFLANMSHEFRTPLNAIIGYSEMLQGEYFGGLNEKQKERLHDIHLCGNHLLQLINDILEFSKGEAGKLELKEEPLSLSSLMEECHRIMRDKLQRKHLTFAMELNHKLEWLYADKRKLRQIILNLLSNAVKFTPEGGKITLAATCGKEGTAIISVKDTGIGIAEADIPKALSVFGQVHRIHTMEGTGLGLPLCKIFSELHGGGLEMTSEVKKGTSVHIILPASRILPEEEAARMVEPELFPAEPTSTHTTNQANAPKDAPKPEVA